MLLKVKCWKLKKRIGFKQPKLKKKIKPSKKVTIWLIADIQITCPVFYIKKEENIVASLKYWMLLNSPLESYLCPITLSMTYEDNLKIFLNKQKLRQIVTSRTNI